MQQEEVVVFNTHYSHNLQDWQSFVALQCCCFYMLSVGQHSVKVDPEVSQMTTAPSNVTAGIGLPKSKVILLSWMVASTTSDTMGWFGKWPCSAHCVATTYVNHSLTPAPQRKVPLLLLLWDVLLLLEDCLMKILYICSGGGHDCSQHFSMSQTCSFGDRLGKMAGQGMVLMIFTWSSVCTTLATWWQALQHSPWSLVLHKQHTLIPHNYPLVLQASDSTL